MKQNARLFSNRLIPPTFFLSLLYFAFVSSDCKNGGIVPPDDNKPDTTSHNFTWQIDTLGDGNGSVLYDVAIIDENNIWVVGEISMKDSQGNWINPPYNIARWNGQQWSLQRLSFVWDFGSGYARAEAVFGFGGNDILVSSGGSVMRWNGSSWTNLSFLCQGTNCLGSVYRIWGQNSADFYGVGLSGSIVHWSGSNWQKLESGTTVDFQDIWGSGTEILAVASYGTQIPQSLKMLQINGMMVTEVSTAGLPLAVGAIWFTSGKKYYVGGAGLFSIEAPGQTWKEDTTQALYYVSSIAGQGLNDIIVGGGLGHLSHYNGSTWKHYLGTELPRLEGNYHRVSIRNQTVVAVGSLANGKAIVTIAKR